MASTERQFDVSKLGSDGESRTEDVVAVELPLSILISSPDDSKSMGITMRTPGRDRELALGFLYSEGLINRISEVSEIKASSDSIEVICSNVDRVILNDYNRISTITSSCGICGKDSISSMLHIHGPKLNRGPQISMKTIESSVKNLRKNQPLFNTTGGSHASAIASINGDIIHLEEDVGRHNALDKVIGHSFKNSIFDTKNQFIACSGRLSFELVQKSLMANIGLLMGVGAPTSLAIDLAKRSDMTLIGFVKSDSFNIYCGENRILKTN
jgi:FdhD protein